MTLQPNQTLYINNLNDRIHKDELKRLLYYLCSVHGRVVDIVCLKTPKMRGQAHVAFQDLASATNAMRALQGMRFCGKPIRIQYARTQSNALKDGPGISKSVDAVILASIKSSEGDNEAIEQSVPKVSGHEAAAVAKPQQEEEEEEDMDLGD